MSEDQYTTALRSALGAIYALQEQISQMQGMFDDEDGAIEQAMDDADEAAGEISALLRSGSAPAEAKGQIIVELDGGLVQAVRGTGDLVGMTYTVVDFDTDGADDEDDKMESVTWPDGTKESAFIHSEEIVKLEYAIGQ